MSVRVEEEEEEEGGKIGTVTREKFTTALLPRRKDRLIGWTVATLPMRFRRQRQYIQSKCEIHPTNLVGTACIFAGTKAE